MSALCREDSGASAPGCVRIVNPYRLMSPTRKADLLFGGVHGLVDVVAVEL